MFVEGGGIQGFGCGFLLCLLAIGLATKFAPPSWAAAIAIAAVVGVIGYIWGDRFLRWFRIAIDWFL